MSKRFVLETSQEEIENIFSVEAGAGFNIAPNFNISPGVIHPVIIETDGTRKVMKAKWGLIPPGAENEREGKENCVFDHEDLQKDEWPGELIEKQRALIPASGFYKWKTTEKKSTPFYVRTLSGNVMALGGLAARWESSSGREVYSFAILAKEANALVEAVGDRMPLVIRPESFNKWLDENVSAEEVMKDVENYPSMLTEMIVNRVSEEVNDINSNRKELIQPIPK